MAHNVGAVLTQGYGSFGSVYLLPTLGFGVFLSEEHVQGISFVDVSVFQPGAAEVSTYVAGAKGLGIFTPESEVG